VLITKILYLETLAIIITKILYSVIIMLLKLKVEKEKMMEKVKMMLKFLDKIPQKLIKQKQLNSNIQI